MRPKRTINHKDFAPCSHCGVPIAKGKGRLWSCVRPGKCSAPQHCRDGWHCSCLDEKACRKRVKRQHEEKRNRPVAATVEQISMEIE